MTDPAFASAAVTAASSLLIQNSARQLVTPVPQGPPVPLTKSQEYVVLGTLGVLGACLLLAAFIAVNCIRDLFR